MKELLLVALAALGQRDWSAALAAGDYRGAWSAAMALADPERRARAEAEIRYQAGDPAGALAAAEAGLAQAPGELEFLFYAAGAALWLQEAELASRHAARLEAELVSAALEPDARAAWSRTAQDFTQRAAALATSEAARNRAVNAARAVSVLGLSATLMALWFVGRRQGRSSNPVS